MRRILFDIEADGLLPTITKIHCICTIDIDTEEVMDFGPEALTAAIDYLATADVLVSHFGVSYDFPALAKVLDFEVPEEQQLDTVVLARLAKPNLKELDHRWNDERIKQGKPTMGQLFGAHSIEAWGFRLGAPKLHTDIEDWSQWTPEIQTRCHGDVATNLKLWRYLDPDSMPKAAVELEHRIQRICNWTTDNGWPFDIKAAGALHAELLSEKHRVETELVETFGGWWAPVGKGMGDVVRAWADAFAATYGIKASDRGVFVPKRDDKRRGYVAGQPCTKVEWITFNPGSRQHIEKCLRKLGWKPTETTETGLAKLDEEQLENLAQEYPQAKPIAHYLTVCKRLGQLVEGQQAWLMKVGPDSRIHSRYNSMGTVTSRMAHYDPNIAQVPSGTSPYGAQCRALFTVPVGWCLVGADMAGLEGRCLAHYLAKWDGGAYGRLLLEGDPHWATVRAMGFFNGEREKGNKLHTLVRDIGGKRAFYAMLYGAGAEKVGKIILDTCRQVLQLVEQDVVYFDPFRKFFSTRTPSSKELKKTGAAAKAAVIEGIPGFSQLLTRLGMLTTKYNGRLPGLDGRSVPVRSEHSALNTLLQSAGAILCKRWNCDAYTALITEGFKPGWDGDFAFVGIIHDELQVACRNGYGERIGEVLTRTAKEAGNDYGFRLPLASGYKVGRTWKDTH